MTFGDQQCKTGGKPCMSALWHCGHGMGMFCIAGSEHSVIMPSKNSQNRQPIADPHGWAMVCLLGIESRLCSAPITPVLYAKWCYNKPSYFISNSSPPSATYMSVNWVSIGSGNGLLPVLHLAITWTNGDILPIEPLGTKLSEILIEKLFIHENAFKYVVCEMVPILSRGRWVNLNMIALYMAWWERIIIYKNMKQPNLYIQHCVWKKLFINQEIFSTENKIHQQTPLSSNGGNITIINHILWYTGS